MLCSAVGAHRTSDLWYRKPALYPLSYEGGICIEAISVADAALPRYFASAFSMRSTICLASLAVSKVSLETLNQ